MSFFLKCQLNNINKFSNQKIIFLLSYAKLLFSLHSYVFFMSLGVRFSCCWANTLNGPELHGRGLRGVTPSFNLRSSVEENYLPARATTVSSIGFTLTNNFNSLLSQWLTLIRIKQ